MAEPTKAELAVMKTAKDAWEWAQLKPDPINSLNELFGFEDDVHVRVLAAVTDTDFEKCMEKWVIDKSTNAKATPAQKAKAAVARGAAYLAAYGYSLGSKPDSKALALTGSSPAPVTGVGSLNKFKMNTVVNQASDVELVALDGKAIAVAYASYRTVFGTVPPPDEELTVEQLTAVKTMVEADLVPYVDFAVWGPHGGRLMRKLKLHGNTFTSDGTLIAHRGKRPA